jgi:hypothetical protein
MRRLMAVIAVSGLILAFISSILKHEFYGQIVYGLGILFVLSSIAALLLDHLTGKLSSAGTASDPSEIPGFRVRDAKGTTSRPTRIQFTILGLLMMVPILGTILAISAIVHRDLGIEGPPLHSILFTVVVASLVVATVFLVRRRRGTIHFIGLVLISAAVTAIIYFSPLGFAWYFVLIDFFHVPLPFNTGADYRPHPVFDHPFFFPMTVFLPVLVTLLAGDLISRKNRRSFRGE